MGGASTKCILFSTSLLAITVYTIMNTHTVLHVSHRLLDHAAHYGLTCDVQHAYVIKSVGYSSHNTIYGKIDYQSAALIKDTIVT